MELPEPEISITPRRQIGKGWCCGVIPWKVRLPFLNSVNDFVEAVFGKLGWMGNASRLSVCSET